MLFKLASSRAKRAVAPRITISLTIQPMTVKRYCPLSSSDWKTPLPNTANPTSFRPVCDRIPLGPLFQLGLELFRRLAATVQCSGCFIRSRVPHKIQSWNASSMWPKESRNWINTAVYAMLRIVAECVCDETRNVSDQFLQHMFLL